MAKRLAWALVLAVAGLLLYGLAIEPYRLELVRVQIKDDYFGRALEGVKVVQVSDLHIGAPGKREEALLRLLARLKPDLLLLTGDYVKWRGDYEGALGFLAQLKARLGVYGVLGDYDWSLSRRACLFCHQPGSAAPTGRHRVRFLKGEALRLAPRGREVWIGAYDPEAQESDGEPGTLKVARPTIMLLHNPLQFDRVEASAPLLCLAGDTHGGQLPLPRLFWRAIGYEKCLKYRAGLFERQDGARLYVSRGVGMSHLPVRLVSRPEVTVFEFVR